MLKGNVIVGQSGGPTSVINASLCGVVQAAGRCAGIGKIFGMRYGIEGFMKDMLVDLSGQRPEVIEDLKTTPSSALGSCRHKLKDDELGRVLECLKKHNIRYMFLIGGNDTMDTIHRIEAYAKSMGYEMSGVGVPKTVDNDLYGTDHTPGFPSAARYIALSVKQAGILARDMQKVDQFVVFQTIGREAGWLAAASAVFKDEPDEAPHIILMPERKFDKDKFLAAVKRTYNNYGFVSIVCGEGVTYHDGTPISASQVRDKFSNIEFGAMAGTSAATAVHKIICAEFKGWRGEFQITESLPMCAADRAVQLDIDEAYMAGAKAVELAAGGTTGVMVTLVRTGNNPYKCTTGTIPLSEVAVRAKPMPDEYISPDGLYITQACLDYLRPLAGEKPKYTKLAM